MSLSMELSEDWREPLSLESSFWATSLRAYPQLIVDFENLMQYLISKEDCSYVLLKKHSRDYAIFLIHIWIFFAYLEDRQKIVSNLQNNPFFKNPLFKIKVYHPSLDLISWDHREFLKYLKPVLYLGIQSSGYLEALKLFKLDTYAICCCVVATLETPDLSQNYEDFEGEKLTEHIRTEAFIGLPNMVECYPFVESEDALDGSDTISILIGLAADEYVNNLFTY